MKSKPKYRLNHIERSKILNRRRHIFAVFILVLGLLIGLSILSYDPADEIILEERSLIDNLMALFTTTLGKDQVTMNNLLGPIGAFISSIIINETIGYPSIIFPVLLILWGWFLLTQGNYSKLLTFTNYALVISFLISAMLGMTYIILGGFADCWSGAIGAFTATLFVDLLGELGGAIVLLTLFFVSIIMAFNIDLQSVVNNSLGYLQRVRQTFSKHPDDQTITSINSESDITIRMPVVEDDVLPEVTEESKSLCEVKENETSEIDSTEISEISNESDQQKDIVPIVELSQDEDIDYVFPSIDLLDHPQVGTGIEAEELRANADLLKEKLARFGIEIETVNVVPGPVITLYELVPASGVKISRIVSLADDLALALAAKGIRIIAPIPGKSAVGVEIPNKNPSIVYLRSVLTSSKYREFKAHLPIALGKTISGEVYVDDLVKMPHLLIAGSTGSGKSVGINIIIASLLFRLHPSEVKFILIDPKKIEMSAYSKLKHHFLAICPDVNEDILTTPANAVNALKSVELEMERRYECLAASGVRNIIDYNERFKAGRLKDTETIRHRKMPFLIVVIDELADLMITAAREAEEPIARLAQLARAVGIHLIVATQRPSVDVITGVIKANFSARIAFQVASKTDSRTILDMNGAEQLLGCGDMLYLPSGSPKPIRIQSAFISTDEVERITNHIENQQGYKSPFYLPSVNQRKAVSARNGSSELDENFVEAAHLVVRHQQGSVSLIQRRLKVGYSRAARIVDELEAAGIVGPYDGSKAREVLVENEQQLNEILKRIL